MIEIDILTTHACQEARDQGKRQTCLAFALCLLESTYSPDFATLSPEYLYHHAASRMAGWEPGSGVSVAAAISASSGIALESECPYQEVDPCCPLPPLPKVGSLHGSAAYLLECSPETILMHLKHGRAVAVGLNLTEDFFRPEAGRIADGGEGVPNSAHAVVIVGHGLEAGLPYFLIINSWGRDWGIDGKAWISAEYLRLHGICAIGA